MISIRKHFTFEFFNLVVNARKKVASNSAAINEKEALLVVYLSKPIQLYLSELNSAGFLSPVSSKNKHHSDFMNVWDSFLKGESHKYSPYNQTSYILGGLLEPLVFRYVDAVIAGKYSEDRAYDELVAKIDNGTFSGNDFRSDFCNCNYCDKPLKLFANKWHIETQVLNDYGWEDHQDCEFNDLQEVLIDCPSGHLLVADWYRMGDFSNIVDGITDVESLGRERAIIGAVRSLARELDFIYLPTGNDIYGIYKRDNRLLFGKKLSEDLLRSHIEVGFVNPEKWCVSIIDRKSLLDALETKVGYNAEEYLDEHIWQDEETAWNFIQVEPGTYKFTYYTDCNKFEDLLSPKEKVSGIRQFFSLKKV